MYTIFLINSWENKMKSQIEDGTLVKINEADIVDGVLNCSKEVTRIGECALAECLGLTTLIGSHVTHIETWAFNRPLSKLAI